MRRRVDNWMLANVAVLAVAAALRLYALEMKPMHHDEGINGFFLINLLRQGIYRYDPTNYHGPTLYYLTVPLVVVFGLSTFIVRLLPVLFGIGTVWLALRLRPWIGAVGAVSAALLIAVSPAAVFYSRYFIHETLFVFFTLALVVAVLRSRLMLASASAAMLFATKETAFISVGTLALAWVVALLWMRPDKAAAQTRDPGRMLKLPSGAVAVFVAITVVFYSSFFTHWPGLSGAIRSLMFWTTTGTSAFHAKPMQMYLTWLLQEEAPILMLAIVGAVAALVLRTNRFAVFAGAWAFGILVAYSLIPYKTPWLALNFVVPMAIVAGYATQVAADRRRSAAVAVFGLAVAVCTVQTGVLNFREYDNDKYPYVYAQTYREAITLVSEVERMAERAGTKQIGVAIASPEHWPLPWYFRDNPRVGYVGDVAERYDPQDVPIVIGREDQRQRLLLALGNDYEYVGVYALRPGARLVLFARRNLVYR